MSGVDIEMPLWVEPRGNGYRVAPLFVAAPGVEHARLQTALERLASQVRRRWRKVKLARPVLDELLWYAFAPEAELRRERVAVDIGRRYLAGDLPVVRFALGGLTYALLPTLDRFCFVVETAGGPPFREQLETALAQRLRALLREDPGRDLEGLFGTGRELVTALEVRLGPERGDFPFEERALDWSARLEGQRDFRGEQELEAVGDNLRRRFPDELARAHGRDAEAAALSDLLFAAEPAALCLVGPLGSGRTTLIEEVFHRRCRADQEAGLPQRRWHQAGLYHLDPTRIISGMSIVGQWERRFEAILDFVADPKEAPERRHRLWIDNPVALLHVGKSAQSDLTLKDVLKPYLEAGQLTLLLEATPEEWRVIQAADRRFADLFQPMRLGAPGLAEAVAMVVARRADLERRYGCRIAPAVVSELFRQPRDRALALPGAVVRPLERLASKHRDGAIGLAELRPALAEDSGLRPELVDPELRIDGEALRRRLEERLIGQPEAVDALLDLVHRLKAGLANPDKPVATLLLIGPTGVGKTQAAKELARLLFGDAGALLRFDMNEYVSDGDVGRLIGDLHTPEGLLTSPVRHRPFALVLLDEIEKAAPAIHDLLLQVLGEGRLTDALGRTTDFSRTIILMTSNLGAAEAGRQLGFSAGHAASGTLSEAAGYRAAVEGFFRPELVNRIDRILVFSPLPAAAAGRIAKLQLEALLGRDGLVRRMTLLAVSDAALAEVVRRGFDPRLGGRSLRRALERDITARVADALVALAPEQPILLRVELADGRLATRVTPLATCPPRAVALSRLDERPRREQLDALTARLFRLRERVYRLRDLNPGDRPPADAAADALLRLTDEVAELLEQVSHLDWAMATRRLGAGLSPKARGLRQRWRRHVGGRPLDLAGPDDLRSFLDQAYAQAAEIVHKGNEAWLAWRMRTDLAEHRLAAVEAAALERVVLRVTSLMPGTGGAEAAWLARKLRAALHEAGAVEGTGEGAGEESGEESGAAGAPLVGYRIRALLAAECGLHLFHGEGGATVPVQVALDPPEPPAPEPARSPDRDRSPDRAGEDELLVLRHYYLDEGGRGGRSLMSDLCTGFVNRGPVTPGDWLLLWWLGLSTDHASDAGAPTAA